MGVLPENWVKPSLHVSDDGSTYAYVIRTPEGARVVADGKTGSAFVSCSEPRFSPVTKKLFYLAIDSSSGRPQTVLVVDDTATPFMPAASGLTTEGCLQFSNDGKRWVAVSGDASQLGGGGGPRPFPEIVVLDETGLRRYRDTSEPCFSPDGKHLAYLVKDETGGTWSLAVDGQVAKTYGKPKAECSTALKTYLLSPNPMFSVKYLADGSLLVLTLDDNGWTVYRDNMPIASYQHNVGGGGGLQLLSWKDFETAASIVASSITTAERAPVAAWWERLKGDESRWRVVRNGKPVDDIVCARPGRADPPVLSADGLHCGYIAVMKSPMTDQEEGFAVVDGVKYGPHRNVWGIAFSDSDNGKHFAYAAVKDSTWSYFVDGKAYPLQYDIAHRPKLSADGAHIAWSAQRGDKMMLAIDGKEVASLGPGAEILWGPVFEQSGTVAWVAAEGKEFFRLSGAIQR
jgi:hypothetical protein